MSNSHKKRSKIKTNSEQLNVQPLLHQALSLHQKGQLQEAKSIYLKVLKQQPGNPDALHLSGLVAFKQNRLEEADRRISKAIKFQDSDANFYSNLGAVRKARGLFDQAKNLYLKALELEPTHADSHNNLGNIYQQHGQQNEAIEHYNAAIRYRPKYPQAFHNLGLIYYEHGDLVKAEHCQKEAIAILPNYPDAHNALGCIKLKLKHFDQAITLFETAINLNQNLAGAYLNLGEALQGLEKLSEAITAYNKAIKFGKNLPETQYVVASAEHLLAALSGKNTKKAPDLMVENLFDKYSETFENHLTDELEYKTPQLLYEATITTQGSVTYPKALDLGCGTGLAAVYFNEIVETFIGVDISNKMLEQAKLKGLYERLEKNEIVKFFANHNESYPIIIAADVFVYIGDLLPVFQEVAKHALSGALFIFSTEKLLNGDYHLQSSGRYKHSLEYISTLAQSCNFDIEYNQQTNLRKEKNNWIIGEIFILKKL
jgi:predicted TPR repeat methyltransferase